MWDIGDPSDDPLTRFGWDEEVSAVFAAIAGPGDEPGRVAVVHRVSCEVLTRSGSAVARPSPRLADRPEGDTLPAVGDWVALTEEEGTEEPTIVAVLPRRSQISRRDPAEGTAEQVLAANIDQVWLVFGIDHDPNLSRVERSLALAWESGATPVVVLTKADLVEDPEAWAEPVREVAIDVDVVVTSVVDGLGLDELHRHAVAHRTIALIGPSGSGKSTLVNTLVGSEVMETAEVRDVDAKGRHTTVTRQLVPLPDGGVVLDTPGLRGLGLWEADLGVDLAFPEVFELASGCRFTDCTHDHEPGCAVKAAVAEGRLTERRVDSYRRLVEELADLARRREVREQRQSEAKPGKARMGRRVPGRRNR